MQTYLPVVFCPVALQSEKEAQGRVAEAQQRIQALMAAKVQADDARAEAEATLARERQKYEGSRTATELRTMMAVQQGQMDAKDKHIELAKDVARRMEQCEKDLAASKAEAAGARAEAELARRALSDIHSSSRDARKREEALKERVADMQASRQGHKHLHKRARTTAQVRTTQTRTPCAHAHTHTCIRIHIPCLCTRVQPCQD